MQGLTCSSNHWPCLDGLIGILYGIGDDVGCLSYINKALEKDPFYSKGLILRDVIFDITPSLRDLDKSTSCKWYANLKY